MNRISRWLPPLLLVAAVTLTMFRAIHCEFLSWDDWENISRNARLHPPSWGNVAYYWQHSARGLYIPLTYSVWSAIAWLNQHTSSPQHEAEFFHSANLVAHAIAMLLVFFIARKLNCSVVAANIGAAIFALHPVQVEAVCWAAGLKDVLAGMFSLAAIYFYLQFLRRDKSSALYIAALAVFICALLCKASAVAAAPIIVAIDLFWLRRSARQVFVSAAPLFVLAGIFAIIGRIAQPATEVATIPLWQRPVVALDSIAFYIGKICWPSSLCLDYGWRISTLFQRDWVYLLSLLSLAILSALVFTRRRVPGIFLGVIILILGITPVLGFLPFIFQESSTVADHYLYLAMLGPAIAAAWCIDRFRSPFVITSFAIATMVLAVQSNLQTCYWLTDGTLFSHNLEINPKSFPSANNLGHYYFQTNDFVRAESAYKIAVALSPDEFVPQWNLARIYRITRNFDAAIAQDDAVINLIRRRADIEIDPVTVFLQSAYDLANAHRFADARRRFEIVLMLDPKNANALQMLAKIPESPTTQK